MKRFFQTLLSLLMILFGISLFIYPTVASWLIEKETASYVEVFNRDYMPAKTEEESTVKKENDPLYEKSVAYNEKIFAEGQVDFSDPWSCVQLPIDMESLSDDRYGYVSIPSMDVELPLYVGASTENMAKGAVILGQTSLPVGGENTNCVIAGHRGYHGAPFFREIEKLETGDKVFITNPWETLTYVVDSIDIIGPYDSHKVMIREGRDMVTLLTCHPYRSHGKQRYVVYCVRDEGESKSEDSGTQVSETVVNKTTTQPFVFSEPDIQMENKVRYASGLAIILMCGFTFLRKRRNCSERAESLADEDVKT